MQQKQISMSEAYVKFWKTWSVGGRASRSEYWWVVLANLIAGFVLGFIGGVIGADTALSSLYGLVALLPGVCIGIRRLHDTGRSGWFILFAAIPILNLILLVFMLQPSEPQANKYGQIPNLAS